MAAGDNLVEPVGGGREVVSAEKSRKKSRTSSRYHRELVLLHTLLGLPLHGSPLRMYPIQQKKADPHPSEEGRGSKLRFQVKGREREAREAEADVVVGEKRARNGSRPGVTHSDMRPKSLPPRLPPRRRPHARSQCMESDSCIACAV